MYSLQIIIQDKFMGTPVTASYIYVYFVKPLTKNSTVMLQGSDPADCLAACNSVQYHQAQCVRSELAMIMV
jgi:hypothetical protein